MKESTRSRDSDKKSELLILRAIIAAESTDDASNY